MTICPRCTSNYNKEQQVSEAITTPHGKGRSLRPRVAAATLGISISTLWTWNRERVDFPKGIRLSPRCTVFNEDSLLQWRDSQAHKGE
nr:AlpA family phage regulatory protein [Ramlibacter sp.]